jgi:hypothetical protein
MFLFDILKDLVKYSPQTHCHLGIEGKLCSIGNIIQSIEPYTRYPIIIIETGDKEMTVGQVRKILSEFDDQEVYLTERLLLVETREICLQTQGVIIGD